MNTTQSKEACEKPYIINHIWKYQSRVCAHADEHSCGDYKHLLELLMRLHEIVCDWKPKQVHFPYLIRGQYSQQQVIWAQQADAGSESWWIEEEMIETCDGKEGHTDIEQCVVRLCSLGGQAEFFDDDECKKYDGW